MRLERLYDENLAQASYLVSAESTDEAVVIDPNRDVEQYLQKAAAANRRLTHVAETHIHADFVSGARELARRAGAQLLLSGEGGTDWQYAVGSDDAAVLLMNGDRFSIGEIGFEVLHTPGHTPEHLSFLVTDGAVADRPLGIFTGDFLFVGDVGRPDLLERAAGMDGTMEASARTLFQSLRRMRAYPDYLQLWPGHGAGSACGKSLGAMPSSTLGYERLFNWAFLVDAEDEFVRQVLTGQPEPPAYFARMKRLNRAGPPPRAVEPPEELLDSSALRRLLDAGDAVVIDTRAPAHFGAGFVPGTINVPSGKSFVSWVATLVPSDRDFVLLVGEHGAAGATRARHLAAQLALVGIDRVVAWGGSTLLQEWARDGQPPLDRMPTIDARALADRPEGSFVLVDVRGDAEWDAGHIPGSLHVFLGTLPAESEQLERDRPIVVTCQGGTRSAIAASLLRARGFPNVTNFAGGLAEWSRRGFSIEKSDVTVGSQ